MDVLIKSNPNPFPASPVLALVGLTALIIFVTSVGILSQTHHCTSPDSLAYLRIAQHWNLTGSIYHIPGWPPELHSTWPPAYPLAIAILQTMTGFSYLITSKVVNYLALSATVVLLYQKHGNRAWVVGLALWAVVKVYAYTWSEPLYFLELVWFAHTLHALLSEPVPHPSLWVKLYVAAALIFATRYIGFFTFELVAVLAGYGFWRRRSIVGWKATFVFVLLVATALFYFWLNERHTGTPSGVDRGTWGDEPLSVFLKTWTQVQLNEFLLIRDWDFKSFDGLTLTGLVFQLSILGIIILKLTRLPARGIPRKDGNTLPLIASIYFAVAVIFYFTFFIVRLLMPFNDLTYRTLCPATLFVLLGLLSWLTQRDQIFVQLKGTLLGFFFVVLLVSPLPAPFRISRLIEIVSNRLLLPLFE